MADSSSSSSGLHRLLDSIGQFSGSNFRVWKESFEHVINIHTPELLTVLRGSARADPLAATQAKVDAWDKANSRLYSLLFFATSSSARLTVQSHRTASTSADGNGQAAWEALNARFDGCTQEARRACHRELFNLKHVAGGDPIDFFSKACELKLRLATLGETVSDDVYLDITLSGLTSAPEFHFIREMHYRVEFQSVEDIQAMATRFFVDQQSRKAAGPAVSGRGAAMAASSSDQCRRCKGYGHFERDCPMSGPPPSSRAGKAGKDKKPRKKRGGGGTWQSKWCSLHRTTTHSDVECKAQHLKKQEELKGLAANLALLHLAGPTNPAHLGSAHLAQLSQAVAPQASQDPSERLTFGFSFDALGAPAAPAAAPAASASAASPTPARDNHLPSGYFGAFIASSEEESSTAFLRSDGSSILMLVDSGATDNYIDPALTPGVRAHMRDIDDLRTPLPIITAGRHVLHGVTTGVLSGTVTDDSGQDRHVSFLVVLVPGLGTNLFSVTAALSHGITCSITIKLGVGGHQHSGEAPDGLALRVETADLWHRRMGHINAKSLDVLRQQTDNGIDYRGDLQDCGACPLGKSSQQPHPKHAAYGVSSAFQLVFVDTLGPFTPVALGGFKYTAKFVDHHTKWNEVVLMKDKTCSTDALVLFNKGTVIPRSARIHVLRADMGTEITSADYRQYCLDVGIQLQFASPNTPQQIGANERAGRTIMNIVRCMLTDSKLPSLLWGEMMQTTVYLSNRTPHAALNNGTPYKALFGTDAHLGHLRVVGARAFVHVETHTKKLDSRAWEGRLVGYSLDSKSYRIYNAQTRRVRESRNVVFIETAPAPPSLDERGFDDGEFTYDDQDDMIRDVRNYTTNHSVDALSPTHAVGDPSVLELLEDISNVTNRDLGINPADPAEDAPADDSLASPGGVSPPAPGDVRRVLDLLQVASRVGVIRLVVAATHVVALRVVHLRGAGQRHVVDVARDAMLGFTEYTHAVGGVQPDVPRTIQEAWASPDAAKWQAAAEREMKSLSDRKVYKLVPRSAVPPGSKIIKSKWVFKRKTDGTFKGRVVAQGDKNGSEMVMKLKKSLYGLAQSPGTWFNTIDPVLVEIEFVALKSDPCVYLCNHDGAKIYLTLYVDDLLLAGNDSDAISMVKGKLHKRFIMTDMGEASLVLGMEIKMDREAGTLTISQEAYCKSILQRFGMSDCKPTSTPEYGSEISNLQPEDTLLDEETRKYQGIVESLMYISQVLRYDIMYATSQLARPMAKPSKIHLVAAKHTLRYLAGTTDFGITYKKGGFKLAFTDSNWPNNPDNGKSTSSYLAMLANAPMGFRSGLQSLTAMSTMEAELVASALAMKEAVYCSNVLTELGFGKQFAQLPVYCDNTATLHALGNRTDSSRTTHIALRFFFIRELVTEGKISIHYVPTDDNLADIGTKHFNKHRFKHLMDLIINFDVNKFTAVEYKWK
eukprot:g14134.t1